MISILEIFSIKKIEILFLKIYNINEVIKRGNLWQMKTKKILIKC